MEFGVRYSHAYTYDSPTRLEKKKSIKIELAKIKTNTNGNEIFFPLFQVMRKIVLRFKNFEFGVATSVKFLEILFL